LLVKVTHKLEPILFSPGKVIIMQDTPPDKFYIITKGVVHVYLRHPDGSEILVDEMHPGQYFGEMALLQGGARTATVRASRSTEVEVVALDKEDFDTLLRDSVVTKTELDRVADQRRSTQARMKRQVQQSRDADDA
jgi:CRP-like cAMP-binding protein